MSTRKISTPTDAAAGTKPKMVFFQWNHRPNARYAKYMLTHTEEHVKCFSVHFDVTVVNQNCDFAEICDRYEPDIAVFESGYQSHVSQRIEIANTSSNPGVPKVGFYNADSWSDRRSGFLSDMDEWGIEDFFSICTTSREYLPVDIDHLFFIPNFIDPDIFRDYGQSKVVPMMITGQSFGLYPWRKAIFPLLPEVYPSLVCPRYGYADGMSSRTLSGEPYARALNASFFAPSCGTMAREVVRKHFEIPGSGSCLIAERTPALEEAGFIGGTNCVFADESNIVELVDELFNNRPLLEQITEAGHQLVHSRHTLYHRPQIYQWLKLKQTLQPGERIVQSSPFSDIVAVDGRSTYAPSLYPGEAADRAEVRKAAESLAEGKIEAAEAHYSACFEFSAELPEARFGLAMCKLHAGEPAAAMSILGKLIETTTVTYGATNPDPVEWSMFLTSLVCQGRIREASSLQGWYPNLRHDELSHVRAALHVLEGRAGSLEPAEVAGQNSLSVHALPARSDRGYVDWLAGLLESCSQPELASELRAERPAVDVDPRTPSRGARRSGYSLLDGLLKTLGLQQLRPNVPALREFNYGSHVRLRAKRLLLASNLGHAIQRATSARRAKRELSELRARCRGSRQAETSRSVP